MNEYPLAIYTANHGLAWSYPRHEIDFLELDACRKALGRLPDFDMGGSGFEGLWVSGTRVFAMRCQSVSAWDFRGRDATYLAVTWVSREEAPRTDFAALLACRELCEPMRSPPVFFSAAVTQTSAVPRDEDSALLTDGFVRASAIIAGLSSSMTAKFKRSLGECGVSYTRVVPQVPQEAVAVPLIATQSQPPHITTFPQRSEPPLPTLSASGIRVSWPVAIAFLIAWALAVCIELTTASTFKERNHDLQQELIAVKAERDQAQGKVQQDGERNHDLQQELIAVKAERDQAQGKVQQDGERNHDLQQELIAVKAERDQAQGKVQQDGERNHDLQQELIAVKAERDQAQGKVQQDGFKVMQLIIEKVDHLLQKVP